MKLDYHPKTNYQQFAHNIILQIVENYPQTFYVGGMVRDLLLGKKSYDIDIATEATPTQISELLDNTEISFNDDHQRFGVIIVPFENQQIEITTFRAEEYRGDRFPKITFVSTAKEDSERRDFTINSLYLRPKSLQCNDFHGGLPDIEQNIIRFIGDPEIRVQEDPLRIVRAYLMQHKLNFQFAETTIKALRENKQLIHKVSHQRIERELLKIKSQNHREKVSRLLEL